MSSIMDLSDCTLCPRRCHVNRLAGARGFCGEAGQIRAARAALYFDEEPVISGSAGSGAVFFCGCALRCVYCQNFELNGDPEGAGVLTPDDLSEIMLALQEQGAVNINLVTASHFLPLVIPALKTAKNKGLSIPVVYNTGSYERVEAIRALEGLVDVWLPDLKYYSPAIARRYSNAPDYFEYASSAIAEMVRQCPVPLFSNGTSSLDAADDEDDPLMLRGVLVRHLALPGCGNDSRKILEYLYRTYGDAIFISLMSQYTPTPQTAEDPLLSRKVTAEEYDSLADYAVSLGITNGFLQGTESQSLDYTPAFDGKGITPSFR